VSNAGVYFRVFLRFYALNFCMFVWSLSFFICIFYINIVTFRNFIACNCHNLQINKPKSSWVAVDWLTTLTPGCQRRQRTRCNEAGSVKMRCYLWQLPLQLVTSNRTIYSVSQKSSPALKLFAIFLLWLSIFFFEILPLCCKFIFTLPILVYLS